MSKPGATREKLASRLGFIFLSAGCAIGLGNVWRFPYVCGQSGGAIFVFLYLFFLAALALPILVMEFAVGRAAQQSVIGQFRTLAQPGSVYRKYGYVAAAGNYLLMMFYTVVTGWMLAYFWYYLTGRMSELTTPAAVEAHFGALLANPGALLFWMGLAIAVGSFICGKGLQAGVERITKVMMSGLLLIMIALAVRSATLPGAAAGLEFYLWPDVDNFMRQGPITVIFSAVGQAFFTLSLGVGSMAIFGSYIGRDHSLTGEAVMVGALDTFVALCAGLIIFPACFAYGVEPGAGPGLILVALPNIFMEMPGGRLWGALFFLFMSFASMSTVVAVFEHIIAVSMDTLHWSRKKASWCTFFAMLVLATPCALGFNVWSWIQPFGAGSMILDLEDFILSNNMLPLGAMVYLTFCCWRYGWGWQNFLAEADAGQGMRFPRSLRWYVAYVIPAVILCIFIAGYYKALFA